MKQEPEQTATLTLDWKGSDPNVQERYNAIVISFSAWCFYQNAGYWDGRETGIAPKGKADLTNVWFVRGTSVPAAKRELERLKEVFRVTEARVQATPHPKPLPTLAPGELEKRDQFSWIWNR